MILEDYAEIYARMHENEKAFSGRSLGAYVEEIANLVRAHAPVRILDYGSGKGYQYLAQRMHERWGGVLPHCYDVGVRQLSARPEGKFGGIICTDVMEHIAEPDVDAVISDVLSFAEPKAFAFFGVACRPAKKSLPDGRNAHLTIRDPCWWDERLALHNRDGIAIVARFDNEPRLGTPPATTKRGLERPCTAFSLQS